ncbi:aminotransferase class 3 [Diplocarpon rosae]|nr:aminotransferase class 3 [Diplocarpon rosae]
MLDASSAILLGGAVLWLASSALAGFAAASSANLAVYWGQNSYGDESGDMAQQRLAHYCKDNRADIKECQEKHGKTIMLSVGGATYDEGGFADQASAVAAAKNVWAMVGPPTAVAGSRPFGSAVVDGFDFDNESHMAHGVDFARELRRLMDESTRKSGRKYLLSAAPQCVFPDANVGDMLDEVEFDFISIQFYNNDCGVKNFLPGGDKSKFTFAAWDKWAKNGSKNPNIRILLGALGNVNAGGVGSYVPGSVLAEAIEQAKQYPSFAGAMLWEMTQMYANHHILEQLVTALEGPGEPAAQSPTPVATSVVATSTVVKPTSSSPAAVVPTVVVVPSVKPTPSPPAPMGPTVVVVPSVKPDPSSVQKPTTFVTKKSEAPRSTVTSLTTEDVVETVRTQGPVKSEEPAPAEATPVEVSPGTVNRPGRLLIES